MQFGERLKELLEARGVTQRALAASLEMDASYLSRVIKNRHDSLPARPTIERLAQALELTQEESDELHILAGKVPADIEACLSDPGILRLIRNRMRKQAMKQ